VPKPLLSYLLPFSRTFNCTSKTTGWFLKEAEIDPNLPTLTKCYSKVAHAFLYDGLLSVAQTVAKPLLSYLLPFSRTFNCTSKTTGWFTKRAEIPTCPLTKCYSKVAHAFLYTLIFFQSHQTVPKPLLSYLLPFPERSIALVKRLAGSPKELKLIKPPYANMLLKVAHAFLYTLMDFFQSHQTVPKPLLSYLLPFPERSVALVKLAGSPKG
jgi:hypothetical protein